VSRDLFRSRLDQIIDMKHPLATLARTVDWGFLEGRFGEVYTDDPGHPPLPTRLMAGLASNETARSNRDIGGR
jgi:IS5 family transposase